jgi:DNA-binding NarL/FixJ family response regulator
MPADIQLTNRERQVVEMIAAGKPNTAIAFELKLSYETIKTTVKRIRSKIGANSRTAVATWAGKHGVCP